MWKTAEKLTPPKKKTLINKKLTVGKILLISRRSPCHF